MLSRYQKIGTVPIKEIISPSECNIYGLDVGAEILLDIKYNLLHFTILFIIHSGEI